jgi:hypothetical protein
MQEEQIFWINSMVIILRASVAVTQVLH